MIEIISLLAIATCVMFALIIVIKGWANPFYRSVAGVVLAAAGVCAGEWLSTFDVAIASQGLVLRFLSELFLVVMLLDGVTAFNRNPDGAHGASWWRALSTLIAVGLGAWMVGGFIPGRPDFREGLIGGVGLIGQATHIFLLLMYIVSIAYSEGLLRTLRDPILYQLKFVLIGLIALAGFRVFVLSQAVFHKGQPLDAVTNGLAMLIVAGLMGYGFIRARYHSIAERIYISPKVLYGSLTFLIIGMYLLGVGAVSQMVRSLGLSFGMAFSVLFVFLAMVGLLVALLSRRARMALRTVVARNFYQSKYDYRSKWLEVTDVFRERDSVDAIWDGLLGVLSRTFSAGRISIWHKIEAEGRFHQVRSTNIESPPTPLDASHGLIRKLAEQDVPMAVDTIGLLSRDSFVQSTHAVLCTPIHSSAELIGFIALSDEVAGLPYGQDDHDLLRAIAHHVGVLLAHTRLAEERQGAAELEALHRFSVFCLHDLKNLAARLSLVVQNAEQHGLDPAFQEAAMRTVRDTTHKMMTLMGKLSLKSVKPSIAGPPEVVELPELINEVVATLKGGTVRWHVSAEMVQPLLAVREELHQVFLNILLNAKQAISEAGDIWIALSQAKGSVVVTVQDTGCGILQERLLSLFRPAQTSRPGGLGIGLYQCKQIIEAHRGTIQVQSEVGQGTLVRIELPLSVSSEAALREASAQTAVSL